MIIQATRVYGYTCTYTHSCRATPVKSERDLLGFVLNVVKRTMMRCKARAGAATPTYTNTLAFFLCVCAREAQRYGKKLTIKREKKNLGGDPNDGY
jgi:hypothetical protein